MVSCVGGFGAFVGLLCRGVLRGVGVIYLLVRLV